jgi:hypothetical protein
MIAMLPALLVSIDEQQFLPSACSQALDTPAWHNGASAGPLPALMCASAPAAEPISAVSNSAADTAAEVLLNASRIRTCWLCGFAWH